MRLFVLLVVATICTLGCATPYQPLGNRGGYTDDRLSTKRYRIVFEGNYSTTTQQAMEFAILRAAEIAAAAKYPYFAIENADTKVGVQRVKRHPALIDTVSSPNNYHTWIDIDEGETQKRTKPTVILLIVLSENPVGELVFDSRQIQTQIRNKYNVAR